MILDVIRRVKMPGMKKDASKMDNSVGLMCLTSDYFLLDTFCPFGSADFQEVHKICLVINLLNVWTPLE